MANSTACRYYTERTFGWMMNNKIIVFLTALSFCLLISTWVMAAQRNRAYITIEELEAELASTPIPPTTIVPETTTNPPTEVPTNPPTEAPTNPPTEVTTNAPTDVTTNPPPEVPQINAPSELITEPTEELDKIETEDNNTEGTGNIMDQNIDSMLAHSRLLSILAA